MLVASMQLLPSYVTNYCFLASCYAHMGRHDDAKEIFRRLTLLTTPERERSEWVDPVVFAPCCPITTLISGHELVAPVGNESFT